MAKAVASGMPKLKIEESSARRQARIDSGSGKKFGWATGEGEERVGKGGRGRGDEEGRERRRN